ncbi:hypothetical protein EJ06DRAFT_529335 [Trichodelitschia bisporula]|uniref:Uncharacterized protein n=1 Tax=Trichodelitschia bisporula TaxID=703511 RepID=A0A6G1HZN8_9PEZI|nr:hypothetical protein EJ06DRAFT_529335 [Trichodelitschia bisporula]
MMERRIKSLFRRNSSKQSSSKPKLKLSIRQHKSQDLTSAAAAYSADDFSPERQDDRTAHESSSPDNASPGAASISPQRSSSLASTERPQHSALVSFQRPVSPGSKPFIGDFEPLLHLKSTGADLSAELEHLTLGGDDRLMTDPSRKRFSEDVADRNLVLGRIGFSPATTPSETRYVPILDDASGYHSMTRSSVDKGQRRPPFVREVTAPGTDKIRRVSLDASAGSRRHSVCHLPENVTTSRSGYALSTQPLHEQKESSEDSEKKPNERLSPTPDLLGRKVHDGPIGQHVDGDAIVQGGYTSDGFGSESLKDRRRSSICPPLITLPSDDAFGPIDFDPARTLSAHHQQASSSPLIFNPCETADGPPPVEVYTVNRWAVPSISRGARPLQTDITKVGNTSTHNRIVVASDVDFQTRLIASPTNELVEVPASAIFGSASPRSKSGAHRTGFLHPPGTPSVESISAPPGAVAPVSGTSPEDVENIQRAPQHDLTFSEVRQVDGPESAGMERSGGMPGGWKSTDSNEDTAVVATVGNSVITTVELPTGDADSVFGSDNRPLVELLAKAPSDAVNGAAVTTCDPEELRR